MKKKKIMMLVCCFTMAASLAGCQNNRVETGSTEIAETGDTVPTVETEEKVESVETTVKQDLTFSRDNFPVMDGSTSMVPLGEGIASVLLGESREKAADVIDFHKTTQSFRNLTDGSCQLVIAAEPQDTVFEEMKSQGFAYEMETIAKEALVFVVNEDNPIDSLTSEQVRDIYAGKITNWKEVGGNDAEIIPFQRNQGAGSQVMMEKLVMGEVDMMEPPKEYVAGEMEGLIDCVKSYDNSANAIGYTVYYYAADMEMARGLKILEIDDVLPQPATLRSEEYPFLNGYYCCISKNAGKTSPERMLYNWLVSEAGQQLINMEGYVSVFEQGSSPTTGEEVVIDDSFYVPYGVPEKKFTTIPGWDTSHLTAREGNGMLIPYCGGAVYSDWWGGDMTKESGKYGFCNEKGELVTEPVYLNITELTFEGDLDPIWRFEEADDEAGYGNLHGFASMDGSYVSECKYGWVGTSGDYILANLSVDDGFVTEVFRADGTKLEKATALQVDGEPLRIEVAFQDGFLASTMEYVIDDSYEGGGYMAYTGYYYLDRDLNITSGPWNYADSYVSGAAIVMQEDDSYCLLNKQGQKMEVGGKTDFMGIKRLSDTAFNLQTSVGDMYLVDNTGKLLTTGAEAYYAAGETLLGMTVNDDHSVAVQIMDKTGKVTQNGKISHFGYELSDLQYAGMGTIMTVHDGNTLVMYDYIRDQMEEIEDCYYYDTIPDASYIRVEKDVYGKGDRSYLEYLLYDQDMQLVETLTDVSNGFDEFQDKFYYITANSNGFSGSSSLISKDGKDTLLTVSGDLEIYNGYVVATTEMATTCYDLDGNVVFCYPFYGSMSGD